MIRALVFSLVLCAGAHMAVGQTSPGSQSITERQTYADVVAQELRQIRQQVDTIGRKTPLAGQQRLAPVYDALLEAEQALAQYKTAPDLELSARKTEVETARSKATRIWREYRLTEPAPTSPAAGVPES